MSDELNVGDRVVHFWSGRGVVAERRGDEVRIDWDPDSWREQEWFSVKSFTKEPT